MKHIPTTATAVEKFKKQAKSLAKGEGIKLHEAQDRVAREAGYEHWKHVTVCAASTVHALDIYPEVFKAPTLAVRSVCEQFIDTCARKFGFNPKLAWQDLEYGDGQAGFASFCSINTGEELGFDRDAGTVDGYEGNEENWEYLRTTDAELAASERLERRICATAMYQEWRDWLLSLNGVSFNHDPKAASVPVEAISRRLRALAKAKDPRLMELATAVGAGDRLDVPVLARRLKEAADSDLAQVFAATIRESPMFRDGVALVRRLEAARVDGNKAGYAKLVKELQTFSAELLDDLPWGWTSTGTPGDEYTVIGELLRGKPAVPSERSATGLGKPGQSQTDLLYEMMERLCAKQFGFNPKALALDFFYHAQVGKDCHYFRNLMTHAGIELYPAKEKVVLAEHWDDAEDMNYYRCSDEEVAKREAAMKRALA